MPTAPGSSSPTPSTTARNPPSTSCCKPPSWPKPPHRYATTPTWRDACIDEYALYNTREPLRYHGARFTLRETGATYDYSLCGDPIYARLLKEKEAIDARLKERERFLKTLPSSGIEITDEETGEITHIYPAVRSSTTNITITLDK